MCICVCVCTVGQTGGPKLPSEIVTFTLFQANTPHLRHCCKHRSIIHVRVNIHMCASVCLKVETSVKRDTE